jgi:GTP cyclohydrolase II
MLPVTRYSEAVAPTDLGDMRYVVYRFGGAPEDEHIAVVCGEVAGKADVLCRVHSECLTGEVLHSLKCDCRQQLDTALAAIAAAGCGVLVYLRQEGRGIGLGNKIRAYALQAEGKDTVDANLALGFAADLRSYDMAAAMLRDLGVASVALMTNNPQKMEGLVGAGMPVVRQVPHWVESTVHSQDYLAVKKARMGHLV